ncbi:hypothetical protein D3C73_869770 [compost metagenome]
MQESRSVSMASRRTDGITSSGGAQASDKQQPGTKVNENSLVRKNERRREQLELEITALEANLARADEELDRLDRMGDTAQLEARWREREEGQSQLDALLELWMELSS